MMRIFLMIPVIILMSFEFATAQNQVLHPTIVYTSTIHDVSQPLVDMPVIQPVFDSLRKAKEIPNKNFSLICEGLNNLVEANTGRDPVLQDFAGKWSPNSTIVNIQGINNTGGYVPPDPAGDIGLNHYIQAVNMSFAIYSKTGALMYGPASLSTLWQGFPIPHTSDGDPIVLYDHLADRWVITQFSLPNYPSGPFNELIAVSQTADPLGPWYRYGFQFDKMPDYPKLAVWPDGYYMSVNMFTAGTMNWAGPAVVVMERDSMLVGKTARMSLFQRGINDESALPADLDGQPAPAGSPGIFICAAEGYLGGGDRLEVYKLHTDWTNPANSVFTGPQKISTAPFTRTMCSNSQNCIPQAGTSRKLDPLSHYVMNRLQYRNFGSYQTIVANQTVDADATDHAGIRWYELRTADTAWSIYQQGTYAPDTNHRWIGSIAMDGSGNIALAYSVSGEGMYPSIRATARRSGDTTGLMTYMEETIMEGAGAQTDVSSRWGDYSCLTVDPQDDKTFWYTNEYYASTSTTGWRTRIASFTINDFLVGTHEKPDPNSKSDFSLTNYPNPLMYSTVISWRLSAGSHVILKIYNPMGVEILTLADTDLMPGEHKLKFDASDLPAGIYFCQLRVNGMALTKKMIVTR